RLRLRREPSELDWLGIDDGNGERTLQYSPLLAQEGAARARTRNGGKPPSCLRESVARSPSSVVSGSLLRTTDDLTLGEIVHGQRYLLVTADDYGIGPATSQGILDLAVSGVVTGSVLLVNSPYAVDAVQAWRRAGEPMELGWHPCLTLDRPLNSCVPSLVNAEGRFWPLGGFLR